MLAQAIYVKLNMEVNGVYPVHASPPKSHICDNIKKLSQMCLYTSKPKVLHATAWMKCIHSKDHEFRGEKNRYLGRIFAT